MRIKATILLKFAVRYQNSFSTHFGDQVPAPTMSIGTLQDFNSLWMTRIRARVRISIAIPQ